MNTKHCVTAGLLSLLISHAASAALLTFSTDADYDSNFREYGTAVFRDSATNALAKSGSTMAAVVVMYNTTATGGSGGSGGTGVATPNNNTFSNFRMQMDFSPETLAVGGDSLGFFTKVNSAENSGYAGIFRLTGTGSADFRLFDSNSNPATGALSGTVVNSTTAFAGVPAGSFAAGTFYTLRLDVVDIAGAVQFTASIFTQGGTQIGSSMVVTDTTSPVLGAGQVGLRMGTQGGTAGANYFDNFSVEAIPEPGVAALSLLGLSAFAGLRRRK